MKKSLFYGVLLIAALGCTRSPKIDAPIRVGVFDGFGGSQTCIWEAVSALTLDPGMEVRTFTTSDIANGVLDSLEAIVIPGGGGSRQYLNMGAANAERIRNFVRQGGGAVGICAGAYLFTETPDYASLGLNGAMAIDIEHDNRGHGVVAFRLTPEGEAIFPELSGRDTLYVMYYEGPVLVERPGSEVSYETFAIMESDVHEEGNAPAGMTVGRPFFIGNRYGEGRVFSSIAHPEGTPGMMWMVPRMIRWTLGKPQVQYRTPAVDPDLYGREILISTADLEYESSCFNVLLYGTPQEKIARLDWLQEHHSWDAKRWVQGLLFDADPSVRLRAARYVADIQYLKYLPDLSAACASESDPGLRAAMQEQLERLRALLP